MEPPTGVLASLWSFFCFLPYFIALLILGLIKGAIMCPVICLILGLANTAVILGLWPVHFFYTYYSLLSAKKLGPVLKFVLCLCIPPVLIAWLPIGILSSILGGAAYGFFAPILGTFRAVSAEDNKFSHCIYDGIWDTVQGSFTVVRDLTDTSYYSYFSIMQDLRLHGPGKGEYYEIRLLSIPGAIIAGALGFLVDMPVISLIAFYKSPYMLFKGWHRLFHDCIGREGPFLETICVPFAGLSILLWPLAVVGAVLGSMVASIFLGGYAAVVVYQESSLWFGLCYILASLSIYDEYSNDILDMAEGSCIHRPVYRRKADPQLSSSVSFSRPQSFSKPPSRTSSIGGPVIELKSFEVIGGWFKECQRLGEIMVSEGTITLKDIEDAKSNKDGGNTIYIGLPAYCLLQSLLRSAKADSVGLLLSDDISELTATNRPKDIFFDWFLNPLLILKEQLKAENLSDAEEKYLGQLVLLSGDPDRLKRSNVVPPELELRRAELDAVARRLVGITKSISRFPSYRRRFDGTMKNILEELGKKNDTSSIVPVLPRSQSMFARILSQQQSFKMKNNSNNRSVQDSQPYAGRDVDIV